LLNSIPTNRLLLRAAAFVIDVSFGYWINGAATTAACRDVSVHNSRQPA